MKKVIVYRSQLLAVSETFIRQQVLALRQWTPVLVGERIVEDGLDLCGLDVRLLGTSKHNFLAYMYVLVCRYLWCLHPPTVRQLRNIGAELMHVHFGTDAVDIWPSVRALGLPMLVTLHGYDINTCREWWESGEGGKRRCHYPRRLLELANAPQVHFVAVSKAIRDRAIKYGIPAEKLTVRHIGVDTNSFRPTPLPMAERGKRVLFVGRLVEKKGLEYLIRAFVDVKAAVADAELVIVGHGPLRNSLEMLAESLDVPARFLGSLTTEQVKLQMQRARIFCLPSITAGNGDAEGLPIVILEAQACGLPVITSANGAVGEAVVQMKSGATFPEKDVRSLTRHVVSLLVDDVLAARISANAAASVSTNFELARCTAALEDTYDDAAVRGMRRKP